MDIRDIQTEVAQSIADRYQSAIATQNEPKAAKALEEYERYISAIGYDPLA